MATCKDCIHEKVCSALIKYGLPWNDEKYSAEKLCFEFLNKADVVPTSEVEKTVGQIAKQEMDSYEAIYKQEVAREIFEEIDSIFRKYYEICSQTDLKLLEPILQGERFIINEMWHEVAELKKKYTESEKDNGD